MTDNASRRVRYMLIMLALMSTDQSSAQERISVTDFLDFACDKSAFYGNTYRYSVDISAGDSPGKSLRELRIGAPLEGSSLVPYLLIESVENPGDPLSDAPYLVSRWEGFDTRQTKRFDREFFEPEHSTLRENRACIIGQVGPFTGLSVDDPFLEALFASPCGVFVWSQTRYDPMFGSETSIEIATEKPWGRVFRVRRPSITELKEVVYTDHPEALMIRTEADATSTRIDSFEVYDGVRVPRKGYSKFDYRGTHRHATFELISVEKCTVPVESWFPELPTGTALIDYPNDLVLVEPRTTEEENLIRKYALAMKGPPIGTKSARILIFLLNLTILLGVYTWWQRRRHA